jgi:uncharacterized protein YecA (UPF0149 family)
MDARTGEIYTAEEVEALKKLAEDKKNIKELLTNLVEMTLTPTEKQLSRTPPMVEPYEPCPCASGKKFKFCCKKD